MSPDPELGGRFATLIRPIRGPSTGGCFTTGEPNPRCPLACLQRLSRTDGPQLSRNATLCAYEPAVEVTDASNGASTEADTSKLRSRLTTDHGPSETMPFVIPLDRRSSTEVLLRQWHHTGPDSSRSIRFENGWSIGSRRTLRNLLQEWCPRSRTTTRDDQFLRRFLVYRLRCTDACTSPQHAVVFHGGGANDSTDSR